MRSAQDHEKRLIQFFRDNPQIRNALKFGKGTMGRKAAPAPGDWEAWVDATSRQQVEELRIKAQEKARREAHPYQGRRWGRYAVAPLAVALIIFLSVVPSGRALANEALKNITSLVGQMFYMQSGSMDDSTVHEEPTDSATAVGPDLEKVQQAARYVGATLLYMNAPGLVVCTVSVSSLEGIDTIKMNYTTADHQDILTYQDITKNEDAQGDALDASGEVPQTHVLPNGEILYFTYSRDGRAIGTAHWKGTTWHISSTSLKWKELLAYVDTLTPVE